MPLQLLKPALNLGLSGMILEENIASIREDLLNALYASASEVPAWVSFTRIARDIFGCDQVAVMVESPDQDMPTGAYADEGLVAPVDSLFAPGEPIWTEVSPYSRTTDGGCALLLAVTDTPQQAARIVLWRAGDAVTFGRETRSLLASLANPLRRSLRIFYRVVDLARRERVSEIALETSRIGVAVLSIDGELLLANSVMDKILAKEDGLRLSQGRLYAEHTDETSALMKAVRRCALNQSADNDPQLFTPMAFARLRYTLPLTVVIRPGAGFYPLRRPLRRTAIMIVRDPAMQAPWPAETLARLFQLSTAEALLASELAKGSNLDEAASSLGVSRNTVRSQLQGIFLKTGTNRQSDLIRTLLNSAATST